MRGRGREGTCAQGWRQGKARGWRGDRPLWGAGLEGECAPTMAGLLSVELGQDFGGWRKPSVLLPSATGTLCYGQQGASTDLSPRPGASGKLHPAPKNPSCQPQPSPEDPGATSTPQPHPGC